MSNIEAQPTTSAAFSTMLHAKHETRTRTRHAMGARRLRSSQSILPIALVGGVVAFISSALGGYVMYLSERDTDEYAGLIMLAGPVIGIVAVFPGVLLAALSAWAFERRSPGAMWIAGLLASAAGPLLLWFAMLMQ